MGVFYCGLAIQTFVVCEQNPSWKNLPLPQCPLGKEVAIAQLVSESHYSSSISLTQTHSPYSRYPFRYNVNCRPRCGYILTLCRTLGTHTLHVVSLLWHVGTTTAQRIRLIAIFSSTIATTAVSLVHAAYIILFGGLPEIFTAIIEVR